MGLRALALAALLAAGAAVADPVDDYLAGALADATAAKNAAARCEYKAGKATESATAAVLERATKAKDECRLLKNDGARAEYALKAAGEERKKQTAPPPPPVTALTAVTLNLDGAAYDFTRGVVLKPFNQTTRYELPLKDGLVFVVLDTPAKGHASYVIERRKPGVYGAPLPLVDYTITVADSRYGVAFTQAVTGHGQWQRWRRQNKPWPLGAIDPRLVFGFDTRSKPAGLATVPEVTPLFDGALTKAMGTTGLRGDIGPYTAWLARGLRTGDLSAALRNAEAAASIPWHVRDDSGKPVLLTGPANLVRQMRTYYGTHSTPENTIDENTAWSMDYAHMPKAAWAGFVANSDDPDVYWIEELQFEAAAAIGQAANAYDRSSNGLMLVRAQGRDYAWGMVSFVHARAATPAAVPDWLLSRAQLDEVIEANLNLGVELSKQPGFQYLSVALGKKGGSSTAGSLSMQSNVIDYIPLAMLHCWEITGDARYLTIGLAHLDGRIAKRWRASPKYAALYPPVLIGTGTGTRFPTSWAEAYQLWGRTSDETTPISSWTRPVGTETNAAGTLLMPYHDPMIPATLVVAEAYKAHGFTTPDIDWLIEYLNARRAGASYTLYEQFAVTL